MSEITPFAFYLTLAATLIALELIIFQMTLFWLLFVGLGALIAALASIILPETSWTVATLIFISSVATITIGLYRPIKRWQNKPNKIPGNNAIGQTVKVIKDISADQAGIVTWSGTDWGAELADPQQASISAGETAHIVALEGIRLKVRP